MAAVWIAAIAALLVGAALLLSWLYGYGAGGFGARMRTGAGDLRERTADMAAEFWDWLRLGH
jgi:hypothetical protein